MSRKIIYLHGSPRKNGNTSAISRIAIEAAEAQKAEITEIDATQIQFDVPGCLSCMKCHQSDDFICEIEDQLSKIVATLPDYDVIVLATPTYWMSYPAQLKMLVDRMGSLMKYSENRTIATPLAGKVFSIIATGNSALENNLDLLEQQWKNMADMMSCRFISCLLPNVPKEIGTLIADPIVVQKAREFGRQLAS